MVFDDLIIPIWFYPVLIWVLIWKMMAAWKAARKGHLVWFGMFFVLNTFGILPILYLFFLKNVKFASVDDLKKKSVVRRKIISKATRQTHKLSGSSAHPKLRSKGASSGAKIPTLA